MRPLRGSVIFACIMLACGGGGSKLQPIEVADVLVVGAGIAGLSAAHEAAAAGAFVLIIDMASVFGGHAVVSGGVLNMVDTPLQREQNVSDSADLAFRDYTRWDEDTDEEWVRYYVEHSRREIYDWLRDLGVEFVAVCA